MDFSDVTTHDFYDKTSICLTGRTRNKFKPNCNPKKAKHIKLQGLQLGYLSFWKILDFDPQNFKILIFLKKMITKQNFSKMLKNGRYMIQ